MTTGIRYISGNTCGCRMSLAYGWDVMVPHSAASFSSSFLVRASNPNKGVEGCSSRAKACNGRHDPKCPSARCLRIIREDTWVPNEDATCPWVLTD
ncbi:hypothetical protein TNCV_3571841 [Trichonephila clavipes]|nr:hypothetical protein TNCV_3571841 [Trichonephila clavipes]